MPLKFWIVGGTNLTTDGDPIGYKMHNLRDDRRDSYLEASKPLVKISTNRYLVVICRRSMILSSTKF